MLTERLRKNTKTCRELLTKKNLCNDTLAHVPVGSPSTLHLNLVMFHQTGDEEQQKASSITPVICYSRKSPKMKQRHTTQHDGDGAAHQTSSIVQGFANGIHGSNGDIKGAILSCSSIEHSIPSLAASSDDEVVSPPRTAAADVHHVIPFEDGDIDNTPKKKKSLCCWQGIGLDGDEISLNVSEDSTLGLSPMPVTPGDSVSPLTERSASTSLFRRGRSIRPASIDYEKHAITDVVYETKSRGSVATLESRNKHLDSKPKQRSICNELMAELDGLSSKLSVVDLDDDSLVSFSKERCVDLARRLEKMEIQLLELVGESSTKVREKRLWYDFEIIPTALNLLLSSCSTHPKWNGLISTPFLASLCSSFY